MRILWDGTLQFSTVKEGNAGVIAAAGAVEVIVEDSLLPILKKNLSKTHSPG